MFMTALSLGGSLVGGLFGASEARRANEEKQRQIQAQRLAARQQYRATESAVNLQKMNVRENAFNSVSEVMRASSENERQLQREVDKTKGTVQARSEGLTSGNSSGRQMAEVYSKGAKALASLQSEEDSMINSIVDKMDSDTNALNNQIHSAYFQTASILAQDHPAAADPMSSLFNGAISGAQTGMALGSSMQTLGFDKMLTDASDVWTTTWGSLQPKAVV